MCMVSYLNCFAVLIATVTSFAWVTSASAMPRVYVHGVVESNEVMDGEMVSSTFNKTAKEKLERSVVLQLMPIDGGAATKTEASVLLSSLVTAKQLFETAEYAEVTQLLKEAKVTFEEKPGSADTFKDYLELLEYLGASYLLLEYGGDAKDVFRQRVSLAPEQLLSDGFNKKVRRKFKKIRKKWLKKKKGEIVIQSVNPTMFVQVNGGVVSSLGAKRTVVLPRGRHRVGCGPSLQNLTHTWIQVKSKKTASIDCDQIAGRQVPTVDNAEAMESFVQMLQRLPNGSETVTVGREVCENMGFDFVAIPFMRPNGEQLEIIGVVFSAKGGLTVQIGSYGFGRDVASVETQAGVFARSVEGSVETFPYQNALVPGFFTRPSSRLTDAPLSPRSMDMLSETESRKSKRRWYRSWWFWTTTAVVVGGLSTAGYYMATADEDQEKFQLEVSW